MSDRCLPVNHFRCVSCDEWAVVETVGTVVEGPKCPGCKKAMQRVSLDQLALKLFPEDVERD